MSYVEAIRLLGYPEEPSYRETIILMMIASHLNEMESRRASRQ
jgi:hypothetical protein